MIVAVIAMGHPRAVAVPLMAVAPRGFAGAVPMAVTDAVAMTGRGHRRGDRGSQGEREKQRQNTHGESPMGLPFRRLPRTLPKAA